MNINALWFVKYKHPETINNNISEYIKKIMTDLFAYIK